MYYNGYNEEEALKKAAYRALLSKMRSISSKSYTLSNKLGNLRSNMKMCLTIDNEIPYSGNYNDVTNGLNNLNNDINSTISYISSRT